MADQHFRAGSNVYNTDRLLGDHATARCDRLNKPTCSDRCEIFNFFLSLRSVSAKGIHPFGIGSLPFK